MDGKPSTSDAMAQTSDVGDAHKDLITEEVSSGANGGPTASRTESLSDPNEGLDPKKKAKHKHLHQTQREDTFTAGPRTPRLPFGSEEGVSRAPPSHASWAGQTDPGQKPPNRLPTCNKPRNGKSQLGSSAKKSRPKSPSSAPQTHNDDLCAPILLACLFCRPLECLWASLAGCHAGGHSLCSQLCGVRPATAWPLLHAGGLDAQCCTSSSCCSCCSCCCSEDCNVCSVCFSTTECLDLAMEFSQMVFH